MMSDVVKRNLPTVHASFEDYYLHGSREKIPLLCDKQTDWDVAVQDNDKNRTILYKLGFKPMIEREYEDSETVMVYESTIDEKKVQISLRKDLNKYKFIWSHISVDFYFNFIWKKGPKYMGKEGVRDFFNLIYILLDKNVIYPLFKLSDWKTL